MATPRPKAPIVDTTSLMLRPSLVDLAVGDTLRPSVVLVVGKDTTPVENAFWTALDEAVVEVDSTGLVTALAPGSGRVQIVLGSHRATEVVTVTAATAAATVATENDRPGTTAWKTASNKWSDPATLAMWASPYTAGPNDTLDVFIHSTKGSVTLTLFRLGWYGGQGGRQLWESRKVPAIAQPACGTPDVGGPVTCPWSRTIRLPIDSGWVSGLYLLKATTADGVSTHYAFVLRPAHRTTFVAVVPQFTWQAYNSFGGVSLYTPHGHVVSFERPYFYAGGAPYLYENAYSLDLSVIRWLEHNKIDVAYVSDADLQLPQETLTPRKGLIFIGHSEYWTWAEYDRVEQMRDAHKHLAFAAGNTAYWNVRIGRGAVTGRAAHVITCYKVDADPGAHRRARRHAPIP